MKKTMLIAALAALLCLSGCSGGTDNNGNDTDNKELSPVQKQLAMPEQGEEIAVLTTNHGTIKVKFFPEQAPKAVENFKTHAKDGYYDGLTFHRVMEEFMIQGGDPLGTGTGGESIWGEPFEDEYSKELHPFRGALCMANSGANTNGSQFFIVQATTVPQEYIAALEDAIQKETEVPLPDGTPIQVSDIFTEEVLKTYAETGGTIHLDYVFGYTHTVFGQVFEGMDVVDEISAVETDDAAKPLEDVIIEKVEIVPYEG